MALRSSLAPPASSIYSGMYQAPATCRPGPGRCRGEQGQDRTSRPLPTGFAAAAGASTQGPWLQVPSLWASECEEGSLTTSCSQSAPCLRAAWGQSSLEVLHDKEVACPPGALPREVRWGRAGLLLSLALRLASACAFTDSGLLTRIMGSCPRPHGLALTFIWP